MSMVEAGEGCGKATTAFITRMDEPIGYAVGNWFEVEECIQVLEGVADERSDDLTQVRAGKFGSDAPQLMFE